LISHILEALSGFIIRVIAAGGYPGVALLMAIESACIPLPSEVIMPFSGALTLAVVAQQYGREPFTLLWVATAGALGCNLGSLVAYEIGRFGGRPLIERYGQYVLLSEHELNVTGGFFKKYGDATVFVCRLLPVVRTFIALPAGVARMPRLRFHLYTFLGSWPWCIMLAWVGMKLGERWNSDPRLKAWFHRFDAVIAGIIVVAVVWFVWSHWKGRVRAVAGRNPI
jgi:membrane protein DedA with SNARE-associated domain